MLRFALNTCTNINYYPVLVFLSNYFTMPKFIIQLKICVFMNTLKLVATLNILLLLRLLHIN